MGFRRSTVLPDVLGTKSNRPGRGFSVIDLGVAGTQRIVEPIGRLRVGIGVAAGRRTGVELSMAMERANQALRTLMTFVPTAYIDVPSLYNVGDILDKAETLLPPPVARQ